MKGITMKFLRKITYKFGNAVIVIFVILITFLFVYVKYWWTKEALSDIAGKEVKTTTVLWSIFKEN